VLPSLEGGLPSVPKVYVEVSDVGEKMKDVVEADGDGVLYVDSVEDPLPLASLVADGA